jgi:hypothetical protein
MEEFMSPAYKEPSLEEAHYTYTDYLEWNEDFRAEIVGGRVFVMAPCCAAGPGN